MKKLFGILFVLSSAVSVISGQTADSSDWRSKFVGTWVVDKDYIQSKGNQTWTITISGDDFRVEQVFHHDGSRREFVLKADGRRVKSQSPDAKVLDSKTYWKDKKLIREYTYKRDSMASANSIMGTPYSTATVVETYYLDDDGSKLVYRRDDDSVWPNRNTPVKMGKAFEDKIVLRRKS